MTTDPFKKKLEEEKSRLEKELPSVARRNALVPNDWELTPSEDGTEADPIDQADIFTEQENKASILADLEARYDAILSALRHIDKGTYGVCEECGKKIEKERLEADPTATTCIAHR